MASPLTPGKQSVSLASPGPPGSSSVRVSKIRRDPPLAVKQVATPDQDRRDARTVVIGILTFTLALLVSGIGLADHIG